MVDGRSYTLLGIVSSEDIEAHPKLGATYTGSELDLLVVSGRRRLGFEVKRTSSPRVMPSMRHAMADLGLERLDVIHAGDRTFPLGPGIRAVSLPKLFEDIDPIRAA